MQIDPFRAREPRWGRRAIAPLALLVLAACPADDRTDDAGSTERRLVVLTPPGPDVGLSPGAQGSLRVRYVGPAGGGIPGAKVKFAIFEDPRESTLSADNAFTDDGGVAQIQVRAGAVTSRFQVHASAPGAKDAVFYVEVSNAGFGTLALTGQYRGALTGLDVVKALTRVTYTLYSGAKCAALDPLQPQTGLRSRTSASLTQSVTFGAIPLDQVHTILGRADRPLSGTAGAYQPRASGCVELPAGSLKAGRQLALSLLVTDLQPRAEGTYKLTSKITLPASNRPLLEALAPWAGLVDCSLDPGEAILDCVLDALDGGDPLECTVVNPSAKAQALAAVRGVISAGCRGSKSAEGGPALESQLAALVSGGTDPLAALAKVEASGAAALRSLRLATTLEVRRVDRSSGKLVGTHGLDSITFVDKAGQATFKPQEVGLARWRVDPLSGSLSARGAATWSWDFAVDEHAFTLRFGLLAREALGKLVLAPLGLATSSGALATQIADLYRASSSSGELKGCAAIEAVACKAARLGPGCLGSACAAGIAALGKRLDSGFSGIDGQHTDLSLKGQALYKDEDGDLRADTLGEQNDPGRWTARLKLGAEVIVAEESTFTGKP